MLPLRARRPFAVVAGVACLVMLSPGLSAGRQDKGGKVKEGQPAPDVSLPATQIDKVLPDHKDGKTLSLKDFQGKKHVVLYFFPKASTPG